MATASDEKMAEGTTVADRYRVIRVLGEGGMGVVYAAEHMLMRKEVALKVLHGEMCTMPEIVARFEREAIAAAHIEHPNVAGATDFGRLPDGACYLVLELLKGTSLRDEIAKGPIPLERALIIMRGVANGVAAAHAKGIVHRDIKPENVMLVDRDGLPDFVKVLDFGIAKMDASHAPVEQTPGHNIVTRVGTIFGTPEYMAPEQAVGDKVDARADIFAMGVMFLEMLTGICPFKGEVLMVLRERLLMTTPIDMSGVSSEPVKVLLKKMLERQADDRLPSANEFLAEIDRLEAPPPVTSFQTVNNVDEVTKSAMAVPSLTSSLANVEAGERPRWLMPAALAASAAGLLILIIALASSGPEMKGQGRLVDANANVVAQRHHTTNGPVAAKQAPPPTSTASAVEAVQEDEPTPAPSDSATPTDDTEDAGDTPAPTASHNVVPATQAQPQPPQKRKRQGGGSFKLGAPKTWFN